MDLVIIVGRKYITEGRGIWKVASPLDDGGITVPGGRDMD
jgi:hypothetical protein